MRYLLLINFGGIRYSYNSDVKNNFCVSFSLAYNKIPILADGKRGFHKIYFFPNSKPKYDRNGDIWNTT